MEFLCPNHRRLFADLPLDEQKELWLTWMENAFARYEKGRWRDVVGVCESPMVVRYLSV